MNTIAKALAEGRRSGNKMTGYPGDQPSDTAAAVTLQKAVTEALGWRPIGWKVGCTSQQAQTSLKTDGPFFGPVFQERCFAAGDFVVTKPDNWRVIEPEIVFRMARKLEPRERPYDVDEALAAVESVHGGIEIVNPRLPRGFDDRVPWYIADGALNDAIILGPARKPLEGDAYARIASEARQNDSKISEGVGANALGGPEIVLAWLANALSSNGMTLEAGSFVSTGVITGLFRAELGDRITASFSELGAVSASF